MPIANDPGFSMTAAGCDSVLAVCDSVLKYSFVTLNTQFVPAKARERFMKPAKVSDFALAERVWNLPSEVGLTARGVFQS